MKHIIFTILTILLLCGSVYGNPAIEALRNELEIIRPTLNDKGVEELKRFNKLREILRSLEQQEKDNKVIRQWELEQKDSPCDTIFHDGFACEKVRI